MPLRVLMLACTVCIVVAACGRRERAIQAWVKAAERRADSAAPYVATIVARPESLQLHVGDTLHIRWIALDARGDTLTGFVPRWDLRDRSLFTTSVDGPPTRAQRPGRDTMTVVPMTFTRGVIASRAVTRVPVSIQARASN